MKSHASACMYNINVPHKLESVKVGISIKCPTCKEIFDHLYYYKQHFDLVDGQSESCGHFEPRHSRPVTLFKCGTKCGKCFTRKDYALSHYTTCIRKMEVDEHELDTDEQNMVDDEEKTLPSKVRIQQLIDKYTQSKQEQAHLLRKINEVEAELKMFKIADSANNRIL